MNKDSEKEQWIIDEWAVLAGLRMILALIVVWSHVASQDRVRAPYLSSIAISLGLPAVVCFLMISGYSIAASLTRPGTDLDFYRRRAWRILPVYVMALVIATAPWLFSPHIQLHDARSKIPPSTFDIIQHMLFLQGWTIFTIPSNLPLWSLSVEVFYYVLAPYIKRLSGRGIAILATVSGALYSTLGGLHRFPFEVNGIAHLCLFWAWLGGWALWYYRKAAVSRGGLLLGGSFLLALPSEYEQSKGIILFIATAILIIQAREVRFPASWRKPLLYSGDVSYPLYCIHYTILFWIIALNGFKNIGHNCGILTVILISSGVIIYHTVDLPSRQLKKRLDMGNKVKLDIEPFKELR